MPDNDVWPPKPDLPDPLTEYDELIEAKLPTLSTETVKWELVLPHEMRLLPGSIWILHMRSRLLPEAPVNDWLLLIQVLREEKDLDFQQAQAVVQSYYQRHGMAPTTKALLKTAILPLVMVALALVAVFSTLFSTYLLYHRDAVLRQPNHGAAIVALDREKSLLQSMSLTLLALIYGFWLIRYLVMRRRKKPRIETRGWQRPTVQGTEDRTA